MGRVIFGPKQRDFGVSRGETRKPRRSRSGRQAIATHGSRAVATPAVLCVGDQDAELVRVMHQRLSSLELCLVRTSRDLHEVAEGLPAASIVALDTKAGISASRAFGLADELWPYVPTVWFGRHSVPSMAPDASLAVRRAELWERPYFDDLVALRRDLIQRFRRAREARQAQIVKGAAFAQYFELGEPATQLAIVIALQTPEHRWGMHIDKPQNESLSRFLSRRVYPRVGVNSRTDLAVRVHGFEQEWLGGGEQGIEKLIVGRGAERAGGDGRG